MCDGKAVGEIEPGRRIEIERLHNGRFAIDAQSRVLEHDRLAGHELDLAALGTGEQHTGADRLGSVIANEIAQEDIRIGVVAQSHCSAYRSTHSPRATAGHLLDRNFEGRKHPLHLGEGKSSLAERGVAILEAKRDLVVWFQPELIPYRFRDGYLAFACQRRHFAHGRPPSYDNLMFTHRVIP
jgi:hypothetical protein